MYEWSSFAPNVSTTTRGLSRFTSERMCLNQLKTSGRSSPVASRPSTSPRAPTTLEAPAACRSDWPETIESESPATHSVSLRCGLNAGLRAGFGLAAVAGGRAPGRVAGPATGGRAAGGGTSKTTSVSTLSSSPRPIASLSVCRGSSSWQPVADGRDRPRHGEPDLALPALAPGCSAVLRIPWAFSTALTARAAATTTTAIPAGIVRRERSPCGGSGGRGGGLRVRSARVASGRFGRDGHQKRK